MNSSFCTGYIYSSTSSSCINCTEVKNGVCLNSADSLCSEYKFDRKSSCINCSTATSGVCPTSDVCSNYRYESTLGKCIDCSLASSSVCTYASLSSCSMFGYDSTLSKCYDCSKVSSTSCLNSSIKGCLNYRYYSTGPICVDCSVGLSGACQNASVEGCISYAYDSTTLSCFDCYGVGITWTDAKCTSCFLSANIVVAYSDGSGCKSTYTESTTTVSFSGKIGFVMIWSIFAFFMLA